MNFLRLTFVVLLFVGMTSNASAQSQSEETINTGSDDVQYWVYE